MWTRHIRARKGAVPARTKSNGGSTRRQRRRGANMMIEEVERVRRGVSGSQGIALKSA